MKYRVMIKMAMLAAVMFSVNIANAALITGDMGVTGSFSATDSMGLATNDLGLATEITLDSVKGTSGSGDIANVMFGDPGTIGNGNISLTSLASVANLFTMGGWTLDLTSMSITDQSVSQLFMGGSGLGILYYWSVFLFNDDNSRSCTRCYMVVWIWSARSGWYST